MALWQVQYKSFLSALLRVYVSILLIDGTINNIKEISIKNHGQSKVYSNFYHIKWSNLLTFPFYFHYFITPAQRASIATQCCSPAGPPSLRDGFLRGGYKPEIRCPGAKLSTHKCGLCSQWLISFDWKMELWLIELGQIWWITPCPFFRCPPEQTFFLFFEVFY